jgi:hypothetical protein
MMSELRKAAEQALTVLVDIDQADNDRDFLSDSQCCKLDQAVKDLRNALQSIATVTYDQQALELCNDCGWKAVIPDAGCLNCQREAALKPVEPYGCVTVVKRPGCADQHWFYRHPELPYIDNADECHTVYAVPPPAQKTPPWLSDEQISDIAISTPPNVHAYGRAIEAEVRRQLGAEE